MPKTEMTLREVLLGETFQREVDRLTARIAELEAERRWIPLRHAYGLPETQTEVIVAYGNSGRVWVGTAFYMGLEDWRNPDLDNFKEFDIYAWMPLPTPPTESKSA